jgi:hypothetical protein
MRLNFVGTLIVVLLGIGVLAYIAYFYYVPSGIIDPGGQPIHFARAVIVSVVGTILVIGGIAYCSISRRREKHRAGTNGP